MSFSYVVLYVLLCSLGYGVQLRGKDMTSIWRLKAEKWFIRLHIETWEAQVQLETFALFLTVTLI